VLKNGYSADERLFEALRGHVKERAGAWKYPRWIEVRSDLPRTTTGKIQRFKLGIDRRPYACKGEAIRAAPCRRENIAYRAAARARR
jgi:acyl-CoA synthetase (AMP-forming)/AMP-acid ligase II